MNLTCLNLNFHLAVRISSHFKPFSWCRLIHEVQDFELFNKNSQIFIRDYQNVIVDPRPKALETHNFSLETQIYFNWRLLYTEPIIEINHLSKLQVLISHLSLIRQSLRVRLWIGYCHLFIEGHMKSRLQSF